MEGNQFKPNLRALLIGINRYPNLAERYQLQGCVSDVELMADILEHNFGFPSENIKLIRNEEATRDKIINAMDVLADQAGENDIVVIHYSGHGSQITDREKDEPDGLDETIVPHDSGRAPHPNRDITDDEIYARLLRLTQATPFVTLLFDCCHSGSISRDPFGANSRWVEPDLRPAEQLPPSPVPPEIITQLQEAAARDLGGPSGWLPLGQRYVLIAGCRDEESSYEYTPPQAGGALKQGALTYFLAQELGQVTPGTTYRDVFERASARVTAAYARQHPQMEGARDRVVFGVQDVQPLRFVPVRERRGEQVILGAGAAHGLTSGSQWAVYPQGTKRVDEQTPRLGLVEITQVRAVTSEARILEEGQARAIVPGSRAVEEAHQYGEMRLVVEIQAPEGYEQPVAELANVIERSALLRQVQAGEPADARAYLIAPRSSVGQEGPVPQLGAVAEATWAVVGQDGLLMLPTHRASEPGVAGVLRDNLEKVVRYRQALALRNPDADHPLQGQVEFILKRQKADGSWEVAETEDAGGQIVFEEGERLTAEIISHYKAPIYVSVLDFGLTGKIGMLHPVQGASEQLGPQKSIEIGVREGDEIELYMPENFPYTPDPEEQESVRGTETVKLFATTHEADFSKLVQEGYRSVDLQEAKGMDSPLNQLLNLALTGQGTRDVRRNRLPPEAAWTTVDRSFTLRRKML